MWLRCIDTVPLAHAGLFVFGYNDYILVEGCLVRYNMATESPGAIKSAALGNTIVNSTISGNVAGHDYGAVYIDDSRNTIIRNTDMSNNTARGEFYSRVSDVSAVGCGSIGIFNSENIELDNCTLNFNYAYLSGGALCVIHSDTATVRSTVMRSNTAIDGAAIEVYSSDNVILDDLYVESCTADVRGGGLFVADSIDVTVANSSFVRNTATKGSGSACYIVESSVHFEGNVFDGNEALSG